MNVQAQDQCFSYIPLQQTMKSPPTKAYVGPWLIEEVTWNRLIYGEMVVYVKKIIGEISSFIISLDTHLSITKTLRE